MIQQKFLCFFFWSYFHPWNGCNEMSKTVCSTFCRETEIETKNMKSHSFVLWMVDMGFLMCPGVLPSMHHRISFRIKPDHRFAYVFSAKPWMHINSDEGEFCLHCLFCINYTSSFCLVSAYIDTFLHWIFHKQVSAKSTLFSSFDIFCHF